MLLSVVHATTYRYAELVARSTQYIRLTPYPGARQRVVRWEVSLPGSQVTMRDAFENVTQVLTLDVPHQEISLVASGQVDVEENDQGEPAGAINPQVFLRKTILTEPDEAMAAFVAPFRPVVQARPYIGMNDLASATLERLPYGKGHTSADFTAAQSFAAAGAIGQDHSHVFITCARLLGIPARYVSGYAYNGNREQVSNHAWTEAWISNRWVSFDVSRTRELAGGYIKLAVGRDYLDACPVRGVRLGGGEETLSSRAQVQSGL
jgi:transglutaminase-like putative cysteine protease